MKKFIFLFLLFPFLAFAQSPKDILKSIQNKVKNSAGFESTFKQSFGGNTKNKSVNTGKFIFTYGDKYIVEAKNFKINSDGKTVWNYNVKQKRVLISNTSDEASSFSIDRYLFKVPDLCNITLIKNGVYPNSISLVPKSNDLEFTSAEVYADENYIVKKVIITDTNNITYILELTDNKVITDISKYNFTFEIPKGIKVVDMR